MGTLRTMRTIRNRIAALCRPAGACLTLALAAAVAAWAPPALADVTEVKVSSAPVSGDTYRLGETIRFTVTFDEAVTVTGATTLAIDMDPADWGTKYASYEAGSGTRTLTFAHTVTNPNFSTQGIAVLGNSLRLNGGGIASAASGTNAALAYDGLGHDADHKVNWQLAPGAPSVEAEAPAAEAPVEEQVSVDAVPPAQPPTSLSATTPSSISVLSGAPASLPGGGWNLNLNTVVPGFGPNVIVKARTANTKTVTLRATGGTCCVGYADGVYNVRISDVWLTYPDDAGNSDMAVHIKTTRGLVRYTGDFFGADNGSGTKGIVLWAKADIEHRGGDFADQDFFTTEAYLQAPGAAVQPTGTSGTNAIWSGKVIAFDSAADFILPRGHVIGGDAEVKVNFASSPTVDVTLDNFKHGMGLGILIPDQTWTGLALDSGGFSDDSGSREIKGTFRNEGSTPGTNANTVGGVFDVKGMMKGGFVATYDGLGFYR